jgi:hypothetical protein
MFKDYLKVLNVENVKNRHLKDARNVKVFGIVQETVKLAIGQNIKLNVMQKLNSQNKCKKKRKINKQ